MTEFKTGSAFAGYRIDGVLGRGGMGTVYLAHEPRLERKVALKVIRPELAGDETYRRRFASESRAAAAIEHPRVVGVHRAGEERGSLYLAMRHIPGRDLELRLRSEGRLSPERAVALVGEVAEALDAIHAAGLIHRDVKPGNVIVGRLNGGEHAYLTDFGLAKAVAASGGLTRTGEVIGSLDYMAPEQIEAGRVDARADVYALGCVLFQLVTGRVPFPAGESSAKLWGHVKEQPPSASAVGGPHLAPLDPVLDRAMAKNPADRFPSAGDLGRAADAAIRGEPVTEPERPVGAGEAAVETTAMATDRLGGETATRAAATPVRPRKRRRRRRRLVALLATLAVIGGATAAVIEHPGVIDRLRSEPSAGSAQPSGITVPDLAGSPLDVAEADLDQLGLRSVTVGGGIFGVVVSENWEVCATDPAGEQTIKRGRTVRLLIDRPGAC
jgi:hypothetical protein